MNTKIARTLKRTLALICALAAILTLFALPVSAKSCGGFQYYVDGPYMDDGEAFATITGHKAAINGTLTIPARIGGYKVCRVSSGAFADRADIKKVVIPADVIYVDDHAFENCKNLRTLVIDEAGIGAYAFSGCTSLKKVSITGYHFADCDPDWYWSEQGNDPLFDAEWEWTHYQKDYDVAHEDVKTRTGTYLTLTADYDDFKRGDTYHWYSKNGYSFYPELDNWADCTGSSIEGQVDYAGEQTVVCEVTNSKGDVVWAEEFNLSVRASLGRKTRDLVEDTYLYGVTSYTVDHFRWKFESLLYKLGIDVYG